MYFHSFYYSFKTLLRNRPQVFWCFAFPILLATMFHFAFSGLSSNESFSAIPVAIVTEENTSDLLRDLFDTLGASPQCIRSDGKSTAGTEYPLRFCRTV